MLQRVIITVALVAAGALASVASPLAAQPGWDDARLPQLSERTPPAASHDAATTAPAPYRARPIHTATRLRVASDAPDHPAWRTLRAELERRAHGNPLLSVEVVDLSKGVESEDETWRWAAHGDGRIDLQAPDSSQALYLGINATLKTGIVEVSALIGAEENALMLGFDDDPEAVAFSRYLTLLAAPGAPARVPNPVLLDPEISAVDLHDLLATRAGGRAELVLLVGERAERLLAMLERAGEARPRWVVLYGWQPGARAALEDGRAEAWLVPDLDALIARMGEAQGPGEPETARRAVPWVLLRGAGAPGGGFALDGRAGSAEQHGLNGNP